MIGRRRRRGLGVTYKYASDGSIINCDDWSNIFQSVCWTPGLLGGAGQQEIPPSAVTTDASGNFVLTPEAQAAATPAGAAAMKSYAGASSVGSGIPLIQDITSAVPSSNPLLYLALAAGVLLLVVVIRR